MSQICGADDIRIWRTDFSFSVPFCVYLISPSTQYLGPRFKMDLTVPVSNKDEPSANLLVSVFVGIVIEMVFVFHLDLSLFFLIIRAIQLVRTSICRIVL